MGGREVVIKQSVADAIAEIAWFIESKGLIATADRFTDSVYDFFLTLADPRKRYASCREPGRALLGYKCVTYKKKYTVVFLETDEELVICEFIPSRQIRW